MAGKIARVLPGSIAEDMGIEPGDILLAINGEATRDLIEYNFHLEDEFLELTVEKASGEIWDCEVEKYADEELGLVFENNVFDGLRLCRNHCPFCFVDQLPPGSRASMQIKDDDYRLSFLEGNFITCTNMKEEDFRRIGELRLSPLYVSVHCVDPLLRQQLLGRNKPAEILLTLQRLMSLGCLIHAQIVLCPGLNDGRALAETLDSLYTLAAKGQGAGIGSVAIVPVGLTRYQQHADLRPLTKEEAALIIRDVEHRQRLAQLRLGRCFVYAADELYLLAGLPFPPAKTYGNFDQLENGVGMASLFISQWEQERLRLPAVLPKDKLAIITGQSGAAVLAPMVADLQAAGLDVDLLPVDNNWLGGNVTVSGLVSGRDIAAAVPQARYQRIFIPTTMLKFDQEVFLDGMSTAQLAEQLQAEICPVATNPTALLTAICRRIEHLPLHVQRKTAPPRA